MVLNNMVFQYIIEKVLMDVINFITLYNDPLVNNYNNYNDYMYK